MTTSKRRSAARKTGRATEKPDVAALRRSLGASHTFQVSRGPAAPFGAAALAVRMMRVEAVDLAQAAANAFGMVSSNSLGLYVGLP